MIRESSIEARKRMITFERRYKIGIRIYEIGEFGYYNIDYPNNQSSCITGTLDDSINSKNLCNVSVIGVNIRGYFTYWIKTPEFRIKTFKAKKVKIIAIDEQGRLGYSRVINVWNKNFDPTYKNCMDIGTIKLKKVKDRVFKDEKSFRKYLGLKEKKYTVKYQQ